MNDLSQTLQDVPLAGLIPVALLVVVGLLLWVAGRQVLRAGFGATGLLLGAFLGWLAGETLNLGVPSWIAALILGIVLACVAALTYRLAVAGALALVFAVAAPLTVLTVHEIQAGETITEMVEDEEPPEDDLPEGDLPEGDLPEDEPLDEEAEQDFEDITSRDDLDRWLKEQGQRILTEDLKNRLPIDVQEQLREEYGEQAFINGFRIPEEFDEHIEQLRSLAERLVEGIRETWQRAPDGLRPYLLASIVLGGLLGILIGTLIPNFSAAVITAFVGSLVWLAGVQVLAASFGHADLPLMPQSGRGWLSAWIIIAIIGLALQWILFSKRADKSG